MTTSSQSPMNETVHATSVAIGGQGVLILGPSASGKSDLALRLIDRGAVLISDDYTKASALDGALFLDAPANISGMMEIRHLGIIEMPHLRGVQARLAIKLEPSPQRMPDADSEIIIAGVAVPLVTLAGLEPSAPIKAELALKRLNKSTT